MLQALITGIVSVGVSIGAFFGLYHPNSLTPAMQVAMHEYLVAQDSSTFGATQPVAGATYTLSGGGVSSSATSIVLASLTLPQTGQELVDSDFSDTFHVTLEPGNRSRQEIVSCTTVTQGAGTTATLSGCTRGLSPITPYTASTSLQFAHGGGTQVIFSDPPQLFNFYTAKANTEYITGAWGFQGTAPTSTNCAQSTELCNKAYVDTIVNAGAATTTFNNGGISELATHAEVAAGTASSSPTGPLVISSGMSNATPGSCNTVACIVVAVAGKVAQEFLDLTANFNFTGSSFLVKNLIASSTAANPITLNGLTYNTQSVRAASSTVLAENGSGTLSFVNINRTIGINTTESGSTGASSTIMTILLPANTLTTTQALKVNLIGYGVGGDVCQYSITFGTGSATSSVGFAIHDVLAGVPIELTTRIFATSTTGEIAAYTARAQTVNTFQSGGSLSSFSTAATLYLGFVASRISGSGTCRISGASAEVLSL